MRIKIEPHSNAPKGGENGGGGIFSWYQKYVNNVMKLQEGQENPWQMGN